MPSQRKAYHILVPFRRFFFHSLKAGLWSQSFDEKDKLGRQCNESGFEINPSWKGSHLPGHHSTMNVLELNVLLDTIHLCIIIQFLTTLHIFSSSYDKHTNQQNVNKYRDTPQIGWQKQIQSYFFGFSARSTRPSENTFAIEMLVDIAHGRRPSMSDSALLQRPKGAKGCGDMRGVTRDVCGDNCQISQKQAAQA